uniref:Uncharacterized protein n=2 Tax=Rhizophagus irregularis (strain DAOM 181602 / DAOM 197198 / MUCL 43194) TaxID=747089 RepID=U9TC51_RHIID
MRVDYPGCYYVPVKERIVELRRFSASDANTNAGAEKEWQVHIRLRNTDDNLDEAGMANVEQGFRMIIDTGATTTVIPDFVRKKLNAQDGWNTGSFVMGQRSGWVKTRFIHDGVTNDVIGYDVLNNIPHYKPCRKPYIYIYIYLQNDIFNNIQQSLQAV